MYYAYTYIFTSLILVDSELSASLLYICSSSHISHM